LSGKSIWIPFKYEKLPQFCHVCGRIYHGSVVCPAKEGSSSKVRTDKPWGAWLRADDYRYRRGGPTRPQSGGSAFTDGSKHAGPPLPGAGGDTLFPGCTKEVPSNKEIDLNPPTSHAVDSSGEHISGFKGKFVTSLILVGGENNVRGLHDVESFTDITFPQLSTCMGESVERQTKNKEHVDLHDTSALVDTGLPKTCIVGATWRFCEYSRSFGS
jgi:hypothetical protein